MSDNYSPEELEQMHLYYLKREYEGATLIKRIGMDIVSSYALEHRGITLQCQQDMVTDNILIDKGMSKDLYHIYEVNYPALNRFLSSIQDKTLMINGQQKLEVTA